MVGKFRSWLNQEDISLRLEETTGETVRFFLAYFRADVKEGRWDETRPNTTAAARPSTVDTYFRCLRAFYNFVVQEGLIR